MLSLLEHMYHELDLVHEFNINPITLKRWLVRQCHGEREKDQTKIFSSEYSAVFRVSRQSY